MTTLVSSQDARNNFSEIMNTAVYGKKNVIITRFDKPQAVLMDYQEYERLMNPKSKYSEVEWQKGFAAIDRIRSKNKKIPVEQIVGEVDKAVTASREEKRDQGSR